VPGKKAKSFEQVYCRTMFFEKVETILIDGVKYILTNAAQVELWTCKTKIVDIYLALDTSMWEVQCNQDNW
jgi:hypothetical protein